MWCSVGRFAGNTHISNPLRITWTYLVRPFTVCMDRNSPHDTVAESSGRQRCSACPPTACSRVPRHPFRSEATELSCWGCRGLLPSLGLRELRGQTRIRPSTPSPTPTPPITGRDSSVPRGRGGVCMYHEKDSSSTECMYECVLMLHVMRRNMKSDGAPAQATHPVVTAVWHSS